MSRKQTLKAESLAKAPHLNNWTLPAWLKAALDELGEEEVAGAKSNPRIIEYRRLAAMGETFGAMEDGRVPWCAIFVNAMLGRAGLPQSNSAMARSFVSSRNFTRLAAPLVGCITVISSSRGPASGHVFFYTGENGIMLQGLGGNQDDQVNIAMFRKALLVGHFWPKSVPLPNPPFDKPVRLARPLLPHEKKAVRDA